MTGAGHINVRAVEGNQVRIHGLVEARSGWWGKDGLDPEEKVRRIVANPPVTQTGNSIRIGQIEDKDLRENVSISYEIEVPADTRFKGETGSGHQTIEGLKGPVQTSTGSGHLQISHIGSGVDAETGSGHIELTDVKGDVRAETGSGHITATGIAGNFRGTREAAALRRNFPFPPRLRLKPARAVSRSPVCAAVCASARAAAASKWRARQRRTGSSTLAPEASAFACRRRPL
jgi:hypothetical protein